MLFKNAKEIPNFPGYLITSEGRVWSTPGKSNHRCGKFLRLMPDKDGYLKVGLYKNRLSKTKAVHRIVLETFIGPCPKGMEYRHLDGDVANNQIDNLCWGTHKDNLGDKKRHGTYKTGEESFNAALNTWQVRIIKRLITFGVLKQREIAKIFNVERSTISKIKCNKNWKHI